MERLLESIYINARPAMELRLSLTSSGRKRMVKIVDGGRSRFCQVKCSASWRPKRGMLESSPIS